MWCGGARETREPHVTIERTVSKREVTKNLPAFQNLSGIKVRLRLINYENFKTVGNSPTKRREDLIPL